MPTDKKENFRRLAEARTNKVIDGIVLLGNLSNTSYYEYTEEQVDAMFQAVQDELDAQKRRFFEKGSRRKKFRL